MGLGFNHTEIQHNNKSKKEGDTTTTTTVSWLSFLPGTALPAEVLPGPEPRLAPPPFLPGGGDLPPTWQAPWLLGQQRPEDEARARPWDPVASQVCAGVWAQRRGGHLAR